MTAGRRADMLCLSIDGRYVPLAAAKAAPANDCFLT